jgi:hypothetical protein
MIFDRRPPPTRSHVICQRHFAIAFGASLDLEALPLAAKACLVSEYRLLHGTVARLDAARQQEVVHQHQREAVGCYLFLLLQETCRCDRFRKCGLI